jgi:Holliday junction resolvase RusA-like endonuclease
MGARRGWEPDARFELAVRVYVSKRNADLDNYVKQACDSLVKAGALVDDRRIDRLTAERWVDRARPRLECELAVLVEVA